LSIDKSKARLKSRRGMLELDFFLTRFIDHQFDQLNAHQKKCFLEMLEWEDPVLYDCLIEGVSPNNADFKCIAEKIRSKQFA